ncbi:MAG: hypothetical protein U0X73_04055 [Thermoanaerobaculia bacterium]
MFTPDGMTEELLHDSDPGQSIRELGFDCEAPAGVWVPRQDLLPEAARWLCSKFSTRFGATLICSAGYAVLGDGALEHRPHIAYNGRPLLHDRLRDAQAIEQTLRRARTRDLLAVVSERVAEPFEPIREGLFLCDVFDGDSVAIIELGQPV